MKILVIGKNGQLGQSIHKIIRKNHQQENDFIFVGRNQLDLSDKDNINHYFANNHFDIIINCAAYTAVDKAEQEQALANQINHLAVKQLSQIAHQQNSKLIHTSTDYVFDGQNNQPYQEIDATNPINIYGKTKLAGEQSIQKTMPTNAIIIRTSWLYSEFGNNFVATMLRLGKQRDHLDIVNDQIGSPTYATDLAQVILKIIASSNNSEKTQIYHYSNTGECSWYGFAQEIFRLSNTKCKLNPITTSQYPTLAKRPQNTVMNQAKISQKFNLNNQDWKQSLNKNGLLLF